MTTNVDERVENRRHRVLPCTTRNGEFSARSLDVRSHLHDRAAGVESARTQHAPRVTVHHAVDRAAAADDDVRVIRRIA